MDFSKVVLVGLVGGIGAGSAGAAPIGIMLERRVDGAAGNELAFVSYPTFDDVIANTNFTTQFSQTNVSPDFYTTDMTWDGGRFVLMLERINDAGAGSELAFASYPAFDDVIASTNSITQFSQINVSPDFNTTGLTWDGGRFLLMLESITDAAGGSELAFVSYPTFDDLIGGTNYTSLFSQINVSPDFNTTGLMWDEGRYTLMLQSITDTGPGRDLAFVTYPTFEYLLAGTNFNTQFSQINVSPDYVTTGLFSFPETVVIPLPSGIWLMAGGLGLLVGLRRSPA